MFAGGPKNYSYATGIDLPVPTRLFPVLAFRTPGIPLDPQRTSVLLAPPPNEMQLCTEICSLIDVCSSILSYDYV